jgi:HD-like signal output (HDOD) protein
MLIDTRTTGLSPTDLLHQKLKLPSPPKLLTKLMSAMELVDTQGIRYVTESISQDASLSIRLLKIVNSPFYGLPRRIAAIDQAIQIIGLRTLQGLVVGTLVMDQFSHLPGMANMREVWADNLLCGLCCKQIGVHLKQQAPPPDDALFLCGLLHNIGRLVVFVQLPEAGRIAYLKARSETIEENDAIKALLGFDYYQVAAELSKTWNLPEILVVTQQYHALPLEAPQFKLEAAIVVLASAIAKQSPFDANSVGTKELLDFVGVLPHEMEEIFALAKSQLAECMRMFSG